MAATFPVQEGTMPFRGYETWYRVIGEGEAPGKFLRSSRSPASWALDRVPATRVLFTQRFGPLSMSIADFTNGPAAHVRIVDLMTLLPEIAVVP